MAGAKKFRGLTQKQRAFTNIIIKQINKGEQMNATQAAMQVYPVTSAKVAQSMGSENLSNPIILSAIEQALSNNGLSLEQTVKNLNKIANHELPDKVSAETILKANIEALKIHNAYPSKMIKKETQTFRRKVDNLSFIEAKKELTTISSRASDFLNDADSF